MTIVIAIFYVSAALAPRQASISPATVYQQDGITFASPNQPGWVPLKSDKLETVFEKRDEDAASTASVKTIKTKTFETDKDRLTGFEALKKEDFRNFKLDSVHFYFVRFKDSQCLQYDGIFTLDETSAPKFKYLNLQGYLCPHPKVKDSAVQIEFSNRSRARGFTEDLISLSKEFFENFYLQKLQKNVTAHD